MMFCKFLLFKGDDQFLQEFFPKYVTDHTFGKQTHRKVFISERLIRKPV